MNGRIKLFLGLSVLALMFGVAMMEKEAPASPAANPPKHPPYVEPGQSRSTDRPAARRDDCEGLSHTAKVAMTARQRGGVMSEMLSGVAAANGGSPHPETDALIVAAFNEPAYLRQENQARAIREFENETFRRCLTQ